VKSPIAIAILAAAIAASAAAQDTYTFDPAHSRPTFEVRHLGLTFQYGYFDKIAGKATLDRAAKKGTVDVTIDATSVRTFDPRLDTATKGEKFLNVEKFPTITFKSSSVVFDGDRPVAIDGDLTLLGVTKPVTLKITSFGCIDHPFNKKPMCGADATATIKRSDFGMTANLPMAPADEVRIIIPVEAFKETAG
jgi:polyisoprenoid-binding protein YceI